MEEVRIEAGQIGDLTSLLIYKNSALVTEQYSLGADRQTAFNVKSVCKSFISALVGIALDKGFIEGLDQKAVTYFPELRDAVDAGKKEITIRHLLTHTSGVQWIENGQIVRQWVESPDWARFFFTLPQQSAPGASFNYNTAGTHVLSVIISRATGMNAQQFGNRFLFKEAGIRIARWDRDPLGNSFGGAELYLTARDMGRFGNLFLNGGVIGNRQLIPAEWVRESGTIQTGIGGNPQVEGYGYQWWVRRDLGIDMYYASGYGGQFIFVAPARGIVVVSTTRLAESMDQGRIRDHTITMLNLLYKKIIPALE